MNFYAVIDTNVVVSAMLKKNSVPEKIVDHALHGKIIPLLNDEILAEYTDVINRPKFKFSQETIETLLNKIVERGQFIDAKDFEDELPDPKDKIFYCVLMTARELLDIVESDGD